MDKAKVMAGVKKYTMIIALVLVTLFFTWRTGGKILLPQNVLRSGEDYFLDDITVGEMEKALQVQVDIVKSSGYDFVHTILGK